MFNGYVCYYECAFDTIAMSMLLLGTLSVYRPHTHTNDFMDASFDNFSQIKASFDPLCLRRGQFNSICYDTKLKSKKAGSRYHFAGYTDIDKRCELLRVSAKGGDL